MKISRFSESQILGILKQAQSGLAVSDICRQHGISRSTLHNWHSKYGGMDVSTLKRNRELERENSRLRRLYANAQLDHKILKEALAELDEEAPEENRDE